MATTVDPEFENALLEDIAQFYDDPLGYVKYALPWGEKGTALEDYDGPDEWQARQLAEVGEQIKADPSEFTIREAIASGHGIGKALRFCTTVMTPDGPRRWGDLKPGDTVFGADGAPTLITQTQQFYDVPMYRVTFDDGSFTDVSSGHLWNVRGRQERRKKLDTWRTLETIELVRLGVKRKNGASMARQWEIPVQGPVQFEEREIDVQPYTMGAWLGDGCRGTPIIGKPYPEVPARIREEGYRVSDYHADGKRFSVYGLDIESDPVFSRYSGERYVPEDYKYNTVENRRALLEGLLDADGTVGKKGSLTFASTSEQLLEDVIWLARSLGGKASRQPSVKRGWYPDPVTGERVECEDCYLATLNLPWNPFSIPHKRDRYTPSEHRYTVRWIDSIEPIPNADCMCISVAAEDGLYQANDFIVTHNSAETAWLILWAMSTRPHLAGVVTANTKNQLTTKTWRELAVWHKRVINSHWFKWTATKFFHVDHEETWVVNAIPNTEHNSEAFAGLHGEHVLIIYDEASAIPDKIWEVTEGAMTTPRAMWFAYGNPTRNTGRFHACFHEDRHRWNQRKIDSRTCRMTNKKELQEWVDTYGEDSDFVRVRIRGEFPRAGSMQFIPSDDVDVAMMREYPEEAYILQPIILAADVARYGDDKSIIALRQGRKLLHLFKYRELNTMEFAREIAAKIREYQPIVSFVDEVGVGAGVVDRLRQLGYEIVGVNAGTRPDDADTYYNKRAEMWGRMREWIRMGGQLPKDDLEMRAALIGVEYGFTDASTGEKLRLESKRDMKKRGLDSPDEGDAIAYTFAELTAPTSQSNSFEPEDAFEPEY